jgi:hypothetical protein
MSISWHLFNKTLSEDARLLSTDTVNRPVSQEQIKKETASAYVHSNLNFLQFL